MIRLLLEYPYIVLPLLFLSVIIISLVVTCIVIWDDSEEIVDSYRITQIRHIINIIFTLSQLLT